MCYYLVLSSEKDIEESKIKKLKKRLQDPEIKHYLQSILNENPI